MKSVTHKRTNRDVTKDMKCTLCENHFYDDNKIVKLRKNSPVCVNCITASETKLQQIDVEIGLHKNKKPPFNFWSFLGILVIAIFAYFCIFTWVIIHEAISIGLAFLGIWIFSLTARLSERINKQFIRSNNLKIEQLFQDRDKIFNKLESIYEQYWEAPEGFWASRKKQVKERDNWECQNEWLTGEVCNRTKKNSKLEFHVHHIIPKSEPDGNHSLDNLVLLCEICHSKIDAPGHHLIKLKRQRQLNKNNAASNRFIRTRWIR